MKISILKRRSLDLALMAALVACPGFVNLPTQVQASEPGDRGQQNAQAQKLVSEALYFGMMGDARQRHQKLDAALALDADCAPARWARGEVLSAGKWIDASEQADSLKDNAKLASYRARRAETSDDLQGHWELAQWCLAQNLPAQAKSHLSEVLTLNPSFAPARELLGHRRVAGRWITPDMVEDATERALKDAADYEQFEGRIRPLAERLVDERAAVREQARLQLNEIQDPRAVAALEALVAPRSEFAALSMIQVVSKWNELRATEALARLSITSPSPAVRSAAAQQLQNRDLVDFVPAMLAEFELPTSVQTQVMPMGNNRLCYREVLVNEEQDQTNVLVRDTAARRMAVAGGNRSETLNRMLRDMMRESRETNLTVAQENEIINLRNQTIASALRTATGANLENDPRSWWNWWNDVNGIQQSGKLVDASYQLQTATYTDQTPQSYAPTGVSTQAPMPGECFVAGTLVMTDRGQIAIETIKVGDQVLAKHPETGALEFRPVLRCTVRSPGKIVEVRVNEEWIRSSPGHPFWVAGEGWVLAGELQSGMMLHSVDGDSPVLEVREGTDEATYNLVVDGFATYFVGEQQILVHDFTNRRPTRELVPGLNP